MKRSVADSTISDDLLPQPNQNLEEYVTDSPMAGYYDSSIKIPTHADDNYMTNPPKNIDPTFDSYNYGQSNNYGNMTQYLNPIETSLGTELQVTLSKSQNSFVQIGNMVQIVPRDLDVKTELNISNSSQRTKTDSLLVPQKEKSQIVQVGVKLNRMRVYSIYF